MAPEEALQDNKKYKVVWQVLQALRAHDDRFNATINKIELNKTPPAVRSASSDRPAATDPAATAPAISSSDSRFAEPRGVARRDLRQDRPEGRRPPLLGGLGQATSPRSPSATPPASAPCSTTRHRRAPRRSTGSSAELRCEPQPGDQPRRRHRDALPAPHHQAGLRCAVRGLRLRRAQPGLPDDAEDARRARRAERSTRRPRRSSSSTTASASAPAASTTTKAARRIITELYEKFFTQRLPEDGRPARASSTRRSRSSTSSSARVEDVLRRALRREPRRRGRPRPRPVHRHRHLHRPPAAVRPDRPRGPARASTRKELHANEIVLLAYYIAAINIEAAFHQRHGGDYQPFQGIVLTDTFQLAEDADRDRRADVPREQRARRPPEAARHPGHHRQPALLRRADKPERRQPEPQVPDARRAHRRDLRRALRRHAARATSTTPTSARSAGPSTASATAAWSPS